MSRNSKIPLAFGPPMHDFARSVFRTLIEQPDFRGVGGHGLDTHNGHPSHTQLNVGLGGKSVALRFEWLQDRMIKQLKRDEGLKGLGSATRRFYEDLYPQNDAAESRGDKPPYPGLNFGESSNGMFTNGGGSPDTDTWGYSGKDHPLGADGENPEGANCVARLEKPMRLRPLSEVFISNTHPAIALHERDTASLTPLPMIHGAM